jgi:hypothetical protein
MAEMIDFNEVASCPDGWKLRVELQGGWSRGMGVPDDNAVESLNDAAPVLALFPRSWM